MSARHRLADLDALPRLGWVAAPSPVTPLEALGASLSLAWLGAKRDDRLDVLHGGTKVRKLDCLLAAAPWADAPVWVSAGAIGSGHLVALTAAAEKLGRRLAAHVFWEDLSDGVEQNLAFTASGPTTLVYRRNRATLALRDPRVLLGPTHRGRPVIVPGASAPAGMAGAVRAGLELAAQIEAGEVPPVDRVFVPLGSGGTAVGLALGLGLAGLRPVVHAVSAVERPFSTRHRLAGLEQACRDWLRDAGVNADAPAAPLLVDRRRVGDGYALPTAASRAACARLQREGLGLEPIYSGKAMAALLGGAAQRGERVLFWVTPRRAGPLPAADDWRDRLPCALRRRLVALEHPGRRRAILGGLAAAGSVALGLRLTGYPDGDWDGAALTAWQAHVVRAAAEALLPPAPGPYDDVPARVDAYVAALPRPLRQEIGLLLGAIEHGTALDQRLSRLTALDPPARLRFFEALDRRGGLQRQMYRGIRDLCLLGHYQRPETWPALGYGGPMVGREPRRSPYDAMRAPLGDIPRRWTT